MDPLNDMPAAERDARISEIFYFFQNFTTIESGRTVGRKIGVVQEILLRKYLEQSDAIRRRMYFEQFLMGKSGASHKVEFSFHPIETHWNLHEGSQIPGTEITIDKVVADSETMRVSASSSKSVLVGVDKPIPLKGAVRDSLQKRKQDLRIIDISDAGVTVDLVDRSRLLASIESKRVGAQRFSSSDKLGAGIQTIEKAKQASLVAIDLDLNYNGSIKPLQRDGAPKSLISIVALGNGVHWTAKDRAILSTYVDFTWLVKDSAIIRYAEYVREMWGSDLDQEGFLAFFSEYFKGMTKQPTDDFEVFDDDFEIITPSDERRSFLEVVQQHIVAVDVLPD